VEQIIVLFPNVSGSTDISVGMVHVLQYWLTVTQIWESAPESPEWIYLLASGTPSRKGEIACKTPGMLKALLHGLPPDSRLDWFPRTPSELEVLADHLEEMLMICAKGKVVFTIHF
jgi:hypothetical protein